MTVVDMIVAQKMILMSIGLAAAPLLAAGVLSLVARLRRSAAKRARARLRAEARAAARQALIDAQAAENAALAESASLALAPDSSPPTDAAAPAVVAQDAPDQPAQEEGEQAASGSPEIQNILSSVFVDDEASNRLEALLAELPEVDASQLVTMSAQIAQQMRAHNGPDTQS